MEKVILLLFCLDNFRNIIQFRYKEHLLGQLPYGVVPPRGICLFLVLQRGFACISFPLAGDGEKR